MNTKITNEEIKIYESKFLKFNFEKLKILYNTISKTHRLIFEIIPFLIHTDQFGLPGFIEGKKVPLGISNYIVEERTILAVQSLFKNWKYQAHKNYKPFVQMLAVIGSCGSIAHNYKSDYDYWVVVRKSEVSREILENFEEKLSNIEKWAAANFRMEVHFFLNDIDELKRNIFSNSEEEAFGTALGILLKDEFFRSSIFICGKLPFWWVAPSEIEVEDYEELSKIYSNGRYIDIGHTSKVDKKDFYGAALFQLIKTLSSPFKSVMKIGLIEKYLNESDLEIVLLSQKLKSKIHTGNLDFNIVDPYIFLYNEVVEYYKKKNDKNLIDLIRICFYLKVYPNLFFYLNKKEEEIKSLKAKVLKKFVSKWKWSKDTIMNLDNYEQWEFYKVYNLFNNIKNFIINTYYSISSKVESGNLNIRFTNTDKLLIRRKLTTFFSREPDKIEKIFNFNDNAYEKVIIFEPSETQKGEILWTLYRAIIYEDSMLKKIPLRSSNNPLELVIWAAVNGIYNQYITRIKFTSIKGRFTIIKIKDILLELSNFFKLKKIYISNTDMLNDATILRLAMIINFDSAEVDSLNTFDIVYLNSWGEVYLKHYQGAKSLVVLLIDMLKNAEIKKMPFKKYFLILYPENYGEYLLKIKKVINSAYDYFIFFQPYSDVSQIQNIAKCYIFSFEKQYALILKDTEYKFKYVDREDDIIEFLQNLKSNYCHLKYDINFNIENNSLKILIDNCILGHIQVFIVENYINEIVLVISNENNKLLSITKTIIPKSYKNYIVGLTAYIDSISKIIRYVNYSSLIHKFKNAFEIYLLQGDNENLSLSNMKIFDIIKMEDSKIKFINCSLIICEPYQYFIDINNFKIKINSKNNIFSIENRKEFEEWKNNNSDIKIWITELVLKNIEIFQEKNVDTYFFLNLKIKLEEFIN